MLKLPLAYYRQEDTLAVARDLLGKILVSNVNGEGICSAIITETEAYLGAVDKASHAYGNRRTPRTNTMFLAGGVAYVYLCYGIHHLFNIVTHKEGIPHAILVRAVYMLSGHEIVSQRTGKQNTQLFDGPGKLTRAMGITTRHNASPLTGNTIWLEDHYLQPQKQQIIITARVGVEYAGDDALLPYRFILNDPQRLICFK